MWLTNRMVSVNNSLLMVLKVKLDDRSQKDLADKIHILVKNLSKRGNGHFNAVH